MRGDKIGEAAATAGGRALMLYRGDVREKLFPSIQEAIL